MALTSAERDWLDGKFEHLEETIVKNRVDIAILKVKAGIFGIIGGTIPVAVMISVYFLTRGTQ